MRATIKLTFLTLLMVPHLHAEILRIEMSPFIHKKIEAHVSKDLLKNKKKKNDYLYFDIEEARVSELSKAIHDQTHRCGGFRVATESAPLPKQSFQKMIPTIDYAINKENELQAWFNNIDQARMDQIIINLSAFHNRYYTSPSGVEAMRSIGTLWSNIAQARNDFSLEYHKYSGYPQETVIATIKGELYPDQIIILGGHGDSINTDDQGPHSRAPGADDNAAGIAVLSEILKTMVDMNYKPAHTIQFIAYAAEEVGVRGSYELANIYRRTKKDVVGVIQFDGVNYRGQTYDMAIVADNTDQGQNKFIAAIVDTYLKVSWKYEQCMYACSDHAAWNYEGYRASYPVEAIGAEQNPHFHTARDTFDKSNNNTDHASLFVKLGMAYLVELDR